MVEQEPRNTQPEQENKSEKTGVAPAFKKVLEKKLDAVRAKLPQLSPEIQHELNQRINEIQKTQKDQEEHPPTSWLDRLMNMVNQMLEADRLEKKLEQITLQLHKPVPSPWEKLAVETKQLEEKSTGVKRGGVEAVADRAMVKAEDPLLITDEEKLQTLVKDTVEKGEQVVSGRGADATQEQRAENELKPQEQQTDIFVEDLRRSLETRGMDVGTEDFVNDVEDMAKRMRAGYAIGRDEQEVLYRKGTEVINQLPGEKNQSLKKQFERFLRDVDESNKERLEIENERRRSWKQELGLSSNQEEFEVLLKKSSADRMRSLIEQAKTAETHEEMLRIKDEMGEVIDDPNKASEFIQLLASGKLGDIEALDQYAEEHYDRGADQPEAVRELRQRNRGRRFADRMSPESRDANLMYQGFSREEIAEMKDNPMKYLNELLDLAHGKSTTSKLGERSGYSHKLQIAIMEISTYYKLGSQRKDTVFGSGELVGREREAYWERILEMYRSRFGLITAMGQIGIESDIEKRTGILAYFGTRETGWFYRQWWHKLADLEIKQHGDELNDLLNMGERFPEVEKYLKNAQHRANRWLETWIRDFEQADDPELAQLAEYNLKNLFGREMTKDGVLFEEILKKDKAEFLKQVKYTVNWGSGEDPDASRFGLSEQKMHTSYDFMRWDMSLAEADARNIHKDPRGRVDGFLYDPQTSAGWRVLLANEYGGEAMVMRMINDIEQNPGRQKQLLSEWEKVQKMSTKVRRHQALLAETHWQKTKKAFRRGEYGAGPRSLMNFADMNIRLGRDNPEIAILFDKMNTFRSITTQNYLEKIRDGKFSAEEREWFVGQTAKEKEANIAAIQRRSVEDKKVDENADQSYMRALSADYSQYKRDYNPGSADELDYGGVDIDGAVRDRNLARAQAQALAAMRSFEEYADRKSTSIRDHHLKGLGLVEMKHIMADILESPLKALEPGGAMSKLYRKTLVSEIFELPDGFWEGTDIINKEGKVIGRKKGQKDFWLNDVAERLGCGLLAPDKNMEIYLTLTKKIFNDHPGTVFEQENLLHNIVKSYYIDVPFGTPWLSTTRTKAAFRNWLSWQRAKYYVIGPRKMIFGRAGGFLQSLGDIMKAVFAEATKGTDLEKAGQSLGK